MAILVRTPYVPEVWEPPKPKLISYHQAAYIAKVPASRIDWWRTNGYLTPVNRSKPAYDDMYYEDQVRRVSKAIRDKKRAK